MRITRAQHADLPFLASLRNEEVNARHSKRGVLTLSQIEEDYFENPRKQAFVAAREGRPVGYVIFEASDDETEVGSAEISVALTPELRGEGLGVALVSAGTRFGLETLGFSTIVAVVLAANEASARAFKRAGYVLEASTPEQGRYVARREGK